MTSEARAQRLRDERERQRRREQIDADLRRARALLDEMQAGIAHSRELIAAIRRDERQRQRQRAWLS